MVVRPSQVYGGRAMPVPTDLCSFPNREEKMSLRGVMISVRSELVEGF